MPADVLRQVTLRADWVTCNAREAAMVTGQNDPLAAARALAAREGAVARAGAAGGCGGAVVRTGAAGCVLAVAGAAPVRVPGFRVTAVDTNGAGDTHTGTFIAALARGEGALAAARTANAAAAIAVTSRGPATAPAQAELERFLAERGGALGS